MKMKAHIDVRLTEEDIKKAIVEHILTNNQAIIGIKPDDVVLMFEENSNSFDSTTSKEFSAYINCGVLVETH